MYLRVLHMLLSKFFVLPKRFLLDLCRFPYLSISSSLGMEIVVAADPTILLTLSQQRQIMLALHTK